MMHFAVWLLCCEEEPMPNHAQDDVIDPTEIASLIAAGEPVMDRRIRVNGRVVRFGECTGKDLMAIADECRRRSAEPDRKSAAKLERLAAAMRR
jgi:hypothetical protein